MNKPCRKCGSTERYERNGRCKPCKRRSSLAYQTDNLKEIVKSHRNWRKENPTKWKIYHFKAKYGITLEQYDLMFAHQKGVCLICEQPKKLVVDHCHDSNKVRGLLCISCNGLLGAYQKLSKDPYKSRVEKYLKVQP